MAYYGGSSNGYGAPAEKYYDSNGYEVINSGTHFYSRIKSFIQ